MEVSEAKRLKALEEENTKLKKCALVVGFRQRSVCMWLSFHALNVVDDVTRGCLAAIPGTLISGRRVARAGTDDAYRATGQPGLIVSDNGAELTSNAILNLVEGSQGRLALNRRGRPMQNRYVESFNGQIHDELLNESLFFNLDHARSAIAE